MFAEARFAKRATWVLWCRCSVWLLGRCQALSHGVGVVSCLPGGLPARTVSDQPGGRRCPPTQRQEHGFRTTIARATRVIVEAGSFGFRPRPIRVGTAIGGVAGRKEHGRGGAGATDGPGLGRRWLAVNGDGVGDLARHGRLLEAAAERSDASPSGQARSDRQEPSEGRRRSRRACLTAQRAETRTERLCVSGPAWRAAVLEWCGWGKW